MVDNLWIPITIMSVGFCLLIWRRGLKTMEAKLGHASIRLEAIDKAVNNVSGATLIQRVISIEQIVDSLPVIEQQLAAITARLLALESLVHVVGGDDPALAD